VAASKLPQSTAVGTASASVRPLTGTTIYYHTNKLVPCTHQAPNSIYRKTSDKNFESEYRSKLQSGGYRDKYKKEDKRDHSYESSVEIEEDKDELDEKNEKILNQIDKQVKKNDFSGPVFIDASDVSKAKRAVRTATYAKGRDAKSAANALPPVAQ